jgi:shikimate dehydrogenase
MLDQYAVIGNPIQHSQSPRIHAAFAAQTAQALEYSRILGDPARFVKQVHAFFAGGGRGLNITVPFKEDAWRLADQRSLRAARAGAANTLTLLPDGQLAADNTDGVGLIRDLTINHGVNLAGRSVLLLGAGGASRGVLWPLLEERPARLVIANRTAAKAVILAASFAELGTVWGCGLEDLVGEPFEIIINGTAAGLADQVPPIPDNCLIAGGVTYDMMYAYVPTAFVRWGQAHGAAQTLDGLGMLVEQAAEAFFLWRGVRPDAEAVMRLLRPGSLWLTR